ncbi:MULTISPECIES: hypothetical protein [Cellvibrio]|uniref:Uncharacterized protein n=1 Tax=Cellvibrio fibrivorans TaxID=126350 RepID=A0ABU1UZC3_9GAMM|nr:hypothetical protein [Cellvibrio fibrivorans]MDR7090540.1 hypothetical protein [Cellvibrio fibrivorans]
MKMMIGGAALFVLGGISVYLLTSRPDAAIPPTYTQPAQATPVAEVESPAPSSADAETSIANAESFYEEAEARREQQLADKAEADRLAKLTAIKERSVECKFWKQQQKTSSAAAKIEEKIIQYCTLQTSSSTSSDSSTPSSTPESTTASAGA